MRFPILIGIIGGLLVGGLQVFSMTSSLEGTLGGIVYYSPLIVYFACLYVSIKRTINDPNTPRDFKTGLKAGGITAVLICLLWGAGLFIGLTHTDVAADVKLMIANHQEKDVKEFLSLWNRQVFFDRTKFWVIPNFLLGFAMTVLINVVFRIQKRRA